MPTTWTTTTDPIGDTGAFDSRMIFGDFDGDGDIDILYQNGNTAGSGIGYLQNNGNGTFTNYTDATAAGSIFAGVDFSGRQISPASFFIFDFDRDGDLDILDRTANTTTFFRNNANGGFTRITDPVPDTGSFDQRMVWGDFDNDGDVDAFYQNGNTAGAGIGFLRNDGALAFTNFTDASAAGSPFAGVSFTGLQISTSTFVIDVDDDGDMDILDRGATQVMYRNDSGSFTRTTDPLADIGSFDARMITGDFDSDGDTDVIYQNGNTAGTGFGYFRNDGGTFTNFTSLTGTPFAGLDLTSQQLTTWTAVDIDNDGDVDIVDRDQAGGGLVLYRQNGAPPTLVSSTPSDNGTGVAASANITLTFSESVSKGNGNIYIYRGDGILIETISVGSAQVTGSGTTWTIDPSVTLSGLTNYYILIDQETFADSEGAVFAGISNATTLNFTTAAVNTAPTFGNLNGDTAAHTENVAVRLDVGGNATVTDAESANFDTGTLTVSITGNGQSGQDVLSVANIGNGAGQIGVSGSAVSYGGVQIGTFTGGSGGANLVITFDADATPAAVQALVRALQYNNTSDTPDTATRTVTVVLTDGDGGTSSTQTTSVQITAVNDAPEMTLTGATATFTEGGAGTDLFSGVSVTNPEAGETLTVTLTVSGLADEANEQLVLSGVPINLVAGSPFIQPAPGGAIMVQVTAGGAAGEVTVVLTGMTSNAHAQQVLDGITYVNAGQNPTAGDRTITVVSISDNGGGANSSGVATSAVVTVAPVDDAAVAVDDANNTGESSAVSGTVFGNDSDVDGPALTVAAVNGSAASVGTQITLASGALLTLNADGTYTYDPNGVFQYVPGPSSGSPNQTATDSFTYTLANGNTATVTITINGEDSEGDVVTGGGGNDVLVAGDGDDTLQGSAGNDTLTGGAGNDTADYSGASGGVQVRLDRGDTPTDGDGGSDTLSDIENVTGSAFNDVLGGNNGANVLSGGGGFDVLVGRDGNDVLYGGSGAANQLIGGTGDDTYHVDANDTIVELLNEGYDTINTTRSTFTLPANVEALTFVGAGAFTGVGNGLDNTLTGGAGDDFLRGGAGNDTLLGAGGSDTADYLTATGAVTANLTGGTASDGQGGTDSFQSIENLRGGAFNDTLYGDVNANILDGSDGNDTLVGRGGNDTLRGGAGTDTADYSDSTSGIVARLNTGVVTDGEGGTDFVTSIENVVGGAHNDVIIASTGDNVLWGGGGMDILIGGVGNDTLHGGAGTANELYGGAGDDTYVVTAYDTLVELSGEGTDLVQTTLNNYFLAANIENMTFTGTGNFAGAGNDLANVLTGGDGADTLTGGGGADTLNGGLGRDTVVVSGASFEYTIEYLGGTQYRITDNVGGRDGIDILNGMEEVRFSNGITAVLNGGVSGALFVDKEAGAPLVRPSTTGDLFMDDDSLVLTLPPLDGLKDVDAPLVLPGLTDDDFLIKTFEGGPQVLPGIEDILAGPAGIRGHDAGLGPLPVDQTVHLDDLGLVGGFHGHDDWLL